MKISLLPALSLNLMGLLVVVLTLSPLSGVSAKSFMVAWVRTRQGRPALMDVTSSKATYHFSPPESKAQGSRTSVPSPSNSVIWVADRLKGKQSVVQTCPGNLLFTFMLRQTPPSGTVVEVSSKTICSMGSPVR